METKRDPRTDPRKGDRFTTQTGYEVTITSRGKTRIAGKRIEIVSYSSNDYIDAMWCSLDAFLTWVAEAKPTVTTARQRAKEDVA